MKGNQRFKKLAKNATPIMFILVFLIAIVPIGKALGVPYWEHGENPTGEVHDDFRTALNSVTIRPADALICTLDGPLDLYQSISSKKYTKNVAYNSSNFVSVVKDNAHGYFFPDYRRFEIWSCEQYVPCFIRELTWTYFIYHEEASEKAIYVYIFEWNTLQPNSSSESYQGDHPQVYIVNAFASEEDENIQVDLQISSGFTDSSELFILEICNEEGDKLNHFFVNLPNNSVSDYNFALITESIIGNSGLLSFTLSYVDPIGEKIVEITTYDAPVR